MSVLDRQLLFVTGKGGVGKTSIAAALASLGARMGKRTLVCEMDAKGALAAAFDAAELDFRPRPVDDQLPTLAAMAMNTEDSLREYLRLFLHVPFAARLGPLARTFDFVADAAPGVKEILGVGKIAYEAREQHYDLIVVDAEATGHIVAQVAAPQVINDLVKVGMVREQTDWMLDILEDRQRTGVVIVTAPEEMPVVESIELVDRLAGETSVHAIAVIANRVLPALFDRAELEVLGRLGDSAPAAVLADAAGEGIAEVVAAAQLNEARRQTGGRHLDRLRDELPADLPIINVPELFTRATGRRVVNLIAAALAEELDVVDEVGMHGTRR